MRRALIIPAAGRGSRLLTEVPKVLVPVAGRPMLDHLLTRHAQYVSATVVVVSPAAEADVRAHCRDRREPVVLAVQPRPTGMLDAILAAVPAVEAIDAGRVWITWCDQLAIRPETLARLAALERTHPDAAVVFPTAQRDEPYIHFTRDPSGRISAVRQRREGEAMPAVGESDAGLFSLSPAAVRALQRFGETATVGGGTAERNFLPFIPWIARTEPVITFPCTDPFESVGINTPEELRRVERYLAERGDA
jgi:bifunctional UDP-N-acetylglucosamine pyrophosphorylase/glucosamine-1-phosphate N-acetyltransferase